VCVFRQIGKEQNFWRLPAMTIAVMAGYVGQRSRELSTNRRRAFNEPDQSEHRMSGWEDLEPSQAKDMLLHVALGYCGIHRFLMALYRRCSRKIKVESRLYVWVGSQKFGRRTERDAQVKIIFRITPCKVFWTRLQQLDVQTSGTYNWETCNWDSTVVNRKASVLNGCKRVC